MKLLKLDTHLSNRNYGLDVMRSIGLMMVFVGHSVHFFEPYYEGVHRVSHFVINGIELFFALSGFLIGNMLLRQFVPADAHLLSELKVFLKRRWYKTLPVYYLAVGINLLVAVLVTGYHHDFNWKYLVFAQNLTSGELWFFPVSYSLAIEEWFYLLYPLVLLGLIAGFPKVNRSRMMIIAGVVFIAVFTAIRFYKYYSGPYHWDTVLRKSILTRLDSSIYGVIFAVIMHYYRETLKRLRYLLLIAGMMMYTVCIAFRILQPDGVFYSTLYFNFIPVSFVLSIPYFYWMKAPGNLFIVFFTTASLICFSFYLFHLTPLMDLFLMLTTGRNLSADFLIFIGYIICAGIFSILWYKYVELPFTNLRERK